MKTIQGPALLLSQFVSDAPPFNALAGLAKWAAGFGYQAIQIPTHEARIFDLDLAAESPTYCDEVKGMLADLDLEISELSTHLQGQLVAVHPAYGPMFDGFAPAVVRGHPAARQEWAIDQVLKGAAVSRRLGLPASVTFSGSSDMLRTLPGSSLVKVKLSLLLLGRPR